MTNHANYPFKRYAIVTGARTAGQVAVYLPSGYQVIHHETGDDGRLVVVIEGRDSAGWTLDDYVLPRLASGLLSGREIDLTDPIMERIPA